MPEKEGLSTIATNYPTRARLFKAKSELEAATGKVLSYDAMINLLLDVYKDWGEMKAKEKPAEPEAPEAEAPEASEESKDEDSLQT